VEVTTAWNTGGCKARHARQNSDEPMRCFPGELCFRVLPSPTLQRSAGLVIVMNDR
jgi:hypothetical protein